MPNEDGKVPDQGKLPDLSGGAAAWESYEPQLAVTRAEELPCINEKMEQAAKLFAEVVVHLEKVAPKHKRLIDDTKMRISDLGMLLRRPDVDAACAHRVLAPIPGVIMQLGKRIGHEVKKGEVLLLLEAMKMENPITAPVAGKIVSLPFAEGQKVVKGAVLATISTDSTGHVELIRSSAESN